MAEIRSVTIDKVENGWIVWLNDQHGQYTSPRLIFNEDALRLCLQEFFNVSELHHINPHVTQINEYSDGFFIQYGNHPAIFKEV